MVPQGVKSVVNLDNGYSFASRYTLKHGNLLYEAVGDFAASCNKETFGKRRVVFTSRKGNALGAKGTGKAMIFARRLRPRDTNYPACRLRPRDTDYPACRLPHARVMLPYNRLDAVRECRNRLYNRPFSLPARDSASCRFCNAHGLARVPKTAVLG